MLSRVKESTVSRVSRVKPASYSNQTQFIALARHLLQETVSSFFVKQQWRIFTEDGGTPGRMEVYICSRATHKYVKKTCIYIRVSNIKVWQFYSCVKCVQLFLQWSRFMRRACSQLFMRSLFTILMRNMFTIHPQDYSCSWFALCSRSWYCEMK